MSAPVAVLGIDPGVYGGLAVITYQEAGKGSVAVGLRTAKTFPLLQPARAAKASKAIVGLNGDVTGFTKREKTQRAVVDERALTEMIRNTTALPMRVYLAIEKVGGLPRQSGAGAFTFGRLTGVCIGAALAAGLEVIEVPPAQWKGALGLTKDKEKSRLKATEIFGAEAGKRYWPLAKDDGVAEATLIAWYVAHHLI